MEELFVYSLLCSIGYEKNEEYNNSLDRLFNSNPTDEVLIDLEGRNFKDAILHTLHLMNSNIIDVDEFGKILMRVLIPIYRESNINEFGNMMYKLWNSIQSDMSYIEPFHTFSYADDCLSYGDEKQCRELYKKALNYYET